MPLRQEAHVDAVLTNMSVAYMQDAKDFIADKVFPVIPVKQQSNIYYTYNKGDFFRDEAQLRGAGTESAGGTYSVEASDPYYCRKWAFHTDVTEEDRANTDNPLNADIDANYFVTQKTLIKREVTWAEKYFKAGVWSTEITGIASGTPTAGQAVRFNNASSDPIKTVTDAIVAMAEKTGYRPNTLVMSPYVFYALKNHEDILDRIKYTQKGIVTADLLATLFEVDKVLIAWGIANTANKGATDNINFIMGKHMLLCYVNPKPALRAPSAGYIFAWTGLFMGAYSNRTSRIPMDSLGIGTERIEAEIAFDAKVIAEDLGVFFKDIVD